MRAVVVTVLTVIGWALLVAFVPSTAWSTPTPDPSATPSAVEPSEPPADEPAEPEPSEPEPPAPTVTETVTVAPEADTPPDAPGQGTGVYVDPATGSVRVGENVGVGIGVAAWLLSVTAGLASAWLVLP